MSELDKQTLAKLVIRIQAGDDAAMILLIEAVQDRLYRFCCYLTQNSQLAQDLSQDALIKVLEKINTLKNPLVFQSWLFRIVKNMYLDNKKSHQNKNVSPSGRV